MTIGDYVSVINVRKNRSWQAKVIQVNPDGTCLVTLIGRDGKTMHVKPFPGRSKTPRGYARFIPVD